ncbi:site-specific integrase [Pseudomonas sp. PhalM4]
MASYENPDHAGRLVIVPCLENAFAELHISEKPVGAIDTVLCASNPPITLYQSNEYGARDDEAHIYHFPMIFLSSGEPWIEANSFLFSLVANKHIHTRPTDEARRKASKLLDYLLFCEGAGVDWMDFSGKRPSLRPTYKYYRHLIDQGGRSAAVINQYTRVVYDFYEFVSKNWFELDMARVDTVKQLQVLLPTATGYKSISVEKRSQTKPSPGVSPVPIGFVRDDGEDLRPLKNSQLAELLQVIDRGSWSAQERLIVLGALMTGARKQTVLTLRMKHLLNFSKDRLRPDGTYIVHAGPGTGIDTKFDKPQRLYFPQQLADDLKLMANSASAKKRRKTFMARLASEYPGIDFKEEDIYVFLSDQGNCYYMAENDPRYPYVKSRQTGQVTETIKRKIMRSVSDKFPVSFSFHWLRATFAFQVYQYLLPLLKDGALQPGEEISIIQHRLHHEDRATTENYLKLFNMYSEKLAVQELYEGWLLEMGDYQDLKLKDENEFL